MATWLHVFCRNVILPDLCASPDFRMALLESLLTEGIVGDDSGSEPALHCKCGQPRSVRVLMTESCVTERIGSVTLFASAF